MKTRQGFVSNSSSSSFVIIATEEQLKSVKQGLKTFDAEVVDEIARKFETVTLDGKEFKMAFGFYSTEDFANDACDRHAEAEDETKEGYDYLDDALNAWSNFGTAIETAGGVFCETGC